MCCEGSGWRSSAGALVGVWQMQNSFGLFLHARHHLFCQMIIGHINVHKYKSKCKQIHATSKEIWSNQTSYTHTIICSAICICISSLFDVQLSAALKALKTVPSKNQWRWLEAFVPTEMSRRHQNDPPLLLSAKSVYWLFAKSWYFLSPFSHFSADVIYGSPLTMENWRGREALTTSVSFREEKALHEEAEEERRSGPFLSPFPERRAAKGAAPNNARSTFRTQDGRESRPFNRLHQGLHLTFGSPCMFLGSVEMRQQRHF